MWRKGDEPVPGYQLQEFLGRGQFGEVWRSTAPGGTVAALKFISLSRTQGLKEFRGIRRVKEIRHAHLMPITALWLLDTEGNILDSQVLQSYHPEPKPIQGTLNLQPPVDEREDTDVQPEWLVVAMLLGDLNLSDRLEQCKSEGMSGIPAQELLDYMEEASKAIDFLNTPQHDLGEGPVSIQHCDIKPANIMLVGGSVVICDFGLARVLTDVTTTATGMVGSPAYMPPESIIRRPGHASDQYSLAITYFELRTGELPFDDENYMAVLDAHRTGKLNLSRLAPAEREVIRKATALQPEDRYPSCQEMVSALKNAVAPPVAGKKTNSVILGIALLALVVTAGVLASQFIWNPTPKPPAPAPLMEYTLTIEPPDAVLEVNGERAEVDANGRVVVTAPEGESLNLKLSASDDYETFEQTLTAEQLKEREYRLTLGRSARYYERQARDKLAAGDESDAAILWQEAIRLDGHLAVPQPTVLRRHRSAVRAMAITGTTPRLFSASDAGEVCLWQLDAGPDIEAQMLRGHEPDAPVECMAVSPDGRWLLTGSWDNTACLWDLQASDELRPIVLRGHEEDVIAVSFSGDSRWAITASFDGTVKRWDLETNDPGNKPTVIKSEGSEVECMATSSDGRWLVTVDVDSAVVRWDLQASDPAGSAKPRVELPYRVKATRLINNGRWLIAAGDDGTIGFVDFDTTADPLTVRGADDAIESLSVDEPSQRLLVGAADGSASFFQLAAPGRVLRMRPLEGHAAPVIATAFLPGAQWAVTGSWDTGVYLWDLETSNSPPLKLPGHSAQVNTIAISPDGNWAATADEKGVILLWHLPTCRMIQRALYGLGRTGGSQVEA